MHDSLYAYAPDTHVADLDDFTDPRGDLSVQVQRDDGHWHRKAVGGLTTACGEAIERRLGQSLRHEKYDGSLCRAGCFSPFELAQSDRINAAEETDS